MLVYLLRRLSALTRKAHALREIRRNGWRCPWMTEKRRGARW